jgi:hypothetical protein
MTGFVRWKGNHDDGFTSERTHSTTARSISIRSSGSTDSGTLYMHKQGALSRSESARERAAARSASSGSFSASMRTDEAASLGRIGVDSETAPRAGGSSAGCVACGSLEACECLRRASGPVSVTDPGARPTQRMPLDCLRGCHVAAQARPSRKRTGAQAATAEAMPSGREEALPLGMQWGGHAMKHNAMR